MFCSNDVRIKLTLMIQNIITYNELQLTDRWAFNSNNFQNSTKYE